MHGSPCQDFSIAGLQAGGDIGSGTRSSLMYETVRIVGKLRPKYVIWENVKNVLSQKHRHNFDNYLNAMASLGYKNYYEVLNAKDYGIPQNRERVFTISIRNDINKEFTFPPKQELHLRLKDMLEEEVEERYYLSEELEKKLSNKFTGEYDLLGGAQEHQVVKKDGVCTTLTSSMGAGGGYIPMVSRIGGIFDSDTSKHQAGSIYDKQGLAPTLDAMQGGYRQPLVETYSPYVNKKYKEFVDEKGYVPELFNPYNKTELNDLAPTLTAQGDSITKSGTVLKAEEPKIIRHDIVQQVRVRKYPVDTDKLVQVLRNAKLEKDITNNMIATQLDVPVTKVEHWFRRDECFAIPDEDIWFKLKELLEITTDEFDKAIMTFEIKDGVYDKANRVYEDNGLAPTLTSQEEKIIIEINKNAKHQQDLVQGVNGVCKTIPAGTHGSTPHLLKTVVSDKRLQKLVGNTEFEEGKVLNLDTYNQTTNENISQCLTEPHHNNHRLFDGYRIRKLTPRECWRLMGFTDSEFDKASVGISNTQLYKMAGNSIVVNVLVEIFKNLFGVGDV